ncbi:MAG: lipopolysaccharide assembly protein LapB [Wenzhouxiangellaceae bacterium]
MPEFWWLLIALLPVAAWSGWSLAVYRHRKDARRHTHSISSNYFRGLNYLLNEQPDKAIGVFLKLAEINRETVETHLALGNLFRRRGEVDKAIRFHRHIMTRPNLSEEHRLAALLELGEDYMRAGLLDRAEGLFSELAGQGMRSEVAIRSLLSIYEQEKDWARAIVQARALSQVTEQETASLIAQLYCERAAEAWNDGAIDAARRHLAAARKSQPECARSYLIEGDIQAADQNWESAARAYQTACELEPDIVVLAIENLTRCFAETDRQPAFLDWLAKLGERSSTTAPVLASAHLRWRQDPSAAIEFMIENLRARPTVRGLYLLLLLMDKSDRGLDGIDPEVLRQLMLRLLSDQPRFRCKQCGFSGQAWHWQCPSCRQWETTKPITGVLGE